MSGGVGPNVGFSWAVPGALAQSLTTDGTFTPTWTGLAVVVAAGGGGQGGGGARGAVASSTISPGAGAGGGGAQELERTIPVVAGVPWTVVIGAGGSAAGDGASADANSGTDGSDGADTTMTDGVTTYTWPGASGGQSGRWHASSDRRPNGGLSNRGIQRNAGHASTVGLVATYPNDIGAGGAGSSTGSITPGVGMAGNSSLFATAVSSPGAAGTNSTGAGGGGGAGGGSGGGGVGGAGGAGGNGDPITGAVGSAGSAAAANTGAGGGGAGGGGNAVTTSGNGGKGGAGGSGYWRVYRLT